MYLKRKIQTLSTLGHHQRKKCLGNSLWESFATYPYLASILFRDFKEKNRIGVY